MSTETISFEGWTLRIRRPSGQGPFQVLFLLHGWLGNEDVMWVFADQVPLNFLVIAPRAIFPAGTGFSWVEQRMSDLSGLEDFEPAVEHLAGLPGQLAHLFDADFSALHLMGFSQGAAVAYCWAALHPAQIRSVVGLAGFVPQGIERLAPQRPFIGKRVFMAHGTRDSIVPVDTMRAGVAVIEQAGGNVTVCEDAVGHKLSASCRRALGQFYALRPR